VVGDRYAQRLLMPAHADFDRAMRRREFRGIRKQVGEHLHQPIAVAVHHSPVRPLCEQKRDLVLFAIAVIDLNRMLKQRLKIDRR